MESLLLTPSAPSSQHPLHDGGYALCNCLSTDFTLLLQANTHAYGVHYMVAQMVEW